MTSTESKTPLWKNPYLIGFVVGAIGLIAIRPIQQAVKGAPPPIIQPAEWSLTDDEGNAFGSKQLEGKVWVADFFFTTCPSICPELTRKMGSLKERLDRHDNIVFVSITVDPERDTPEVLRAHREKIETADERWIFLTGSRDEVHALLNDNFKLHVGERKPLPPKPDAAAEQLQGDLYDIAHSQQFVLFDQRGALRALVTPDSHGLRRIGDAAILLLEQGPDA